MSLTSKDCVAMLLAGGQGTRLLSLTKNVAKPAVPFGGKYRIIDFPLSNCINSGIDTIGVLTQYQPFELNQYIGNGQPWDLDRLNGGVFVLPPYVRGKTGEWYKGTANAIYQNIGFIERFAPKYVLILSGDHVYKMNYDKMLNYHIQNKSDCTIAVINVSLEEASRFGIMNTDKNMKIVEFEEKPKKPKSTKASMGIYIFSWDKLKAYLIDDENNKNSENDFGKNIIPNMLNNNERMFAYEFEGYWKDVGTISSLWQANMDILEAKADDPNSINLNDNTWKIYARNLAFPPQYVGAKALIKKSIITEGCLIEGIVENSIISSSVKIEKDTIIKNSVIMPGAVIKSGSIIEYAIIGAEAQIGNNVKIGAEQNVPLDGEWKIAVVGPKSVVPNNTVINQNEVFDREDV